MAAAFQLKHPFSEHIDKLNWHGLSKNPNAISLLEQNLDIVYWHWLSSNPNAIPILEQNLDKVDWSQLSLNPNAIPILEQNLDKVDWSQLSLNPNAIHILEQNLDKVNWWKLSHNPNAIHILEQNLGKVNWEYLSDNPNAIHLLEPYLLRPTQPPHSRCNFLTDDHLILVGARPETFTLDYIVNIDGLALIINLEDDCNSAWYSSKLPLDIELFRIPTKSGLPPTKSLAFQALEKIRSAIAIGKSVYIHCNGGHGRAGTLGAFVLGKLHQLDAFEAVSELEHRRMTRPDQSKNYIPTPETNAQVKFLVKELGLKPGHVTPDRSDRSWLTIVRKDRKKYNIVSEKTHPTHNVVTYEYEMAWSTLSSNPSAMHILEQNRLRVNWYYLSSNPNAIHLLEQNLDKVNWKWLSANPNAIPILEQNLYKVNWERLSSNPNAIHILEQNMDKVDWLNLSANPNIFEEVYDYVLK